VSAALPDALAVSGGLLLASWAGAVVLDALDPRGLAGASRAVRWALGFCSGTGLVALGLLGMGLAGVRFAAAPIAVLLAAAASLAAWAGTWRAPAGAQRGARGANDARGARGASEAHGAVTAGGTRGARWVAALARPFVAPSRAADEPSVAPATPGAPRAARLVLLLLVAGAAAVIGRSSLGYGAQFADAHGLWLLKARVFATDGGFDGAYFHEWADGHERRAYPALLPLAGAWLHMLAGRVDDTLVKLLHVGYLLALLVLVHALLAARLPGWLAAAGLLAFCTGRQTLLATVWGVADMPLACLLLAAMAALLPGGARAGDEASRRGRLARAAWFLALAAFTKGEGMVAAPVVAAAWWLAGRRATPRPRLGTACLLVVPAALLAAAWLAVPARHGIGLTLGPGAELPPAAEATARLSELVRTALPVMAGPAWLFAWPLALLAAARPAWRARAADRALLLLAPLGLLLADAAVYVAQSGDLPWLLSTTLGRLLYHGFPAVFVWTLTALGASPSLPPAPAPAPMQAPEPVPAPGGDDSGRRA
jgi:hypothetical protein